MTTIAENTQKAAEYLSTMSADAFADWLYSGFRALSGSVADQPPFGTAYDHLMSGEDITEDLAAAYRLLEKERRGQGFLNALGALVRRFKIADEIDQRAFSYALRLGARINAFGPQPSPHFSG